MRRSSRRRLARFADFAIPWGVGLFLALVVLGEPDDERIPGEVALGMVLAAAQATSSVLRKLGLRDRVQAVVFAYDVGLCARAHPEVGGESPYSRPMWRRRGGRTVIGMTPLATSPTPRPGGEPQARGNRVSNG